MVNKKEFLIDRINNALLNNSEGLALTVPYGDEKHIDMLFTELQNEEIRAEKMSFHGRRGMHIITKLNHKVDDLLIEKMFMYCQL
jgi:replicative superfamily II helicase